MGSNNLIFKGLGLIALSIMVIGQWQLSSRNQGNSGRLSDAWDFRSELHGGIGKIQAQGKNFDLSDREVILNRETILEKQKAEKQAAEAKAKAEKTAKKETAEAKKKGKKKLVKKKAKKKKTEVAKEEPAESTSGGDDSFSPSAAAAAAAPRNFGPAPAAAAFGMQDEIMWRELLLIKPNPQAVSEFIQQRAQGLISDELYFKLLEEMLLKDESFQSLAIQALHAYESYESFQLLARYEAIVGPELQPKVVSALEQYLEKEYIPILEQALAKGDSTVQFYAAVLASQLAERLVKLAQQKDSTDPRVLRGYATAPEADHYRGLIPLLNELKKSGDRDVAQAADTALAQLTRVITT